MDLTRRRAVLAGLGGLGVSACATAAPVAAVAPRPSRAAFEPRRIAPILMSPRRIIRITVCTRPFRALGPRLDVEAVGDTTVIHNYGHGGSGWSLSWGSSAIAARRAMEVMAARSGEPGEVAVIGCGALGLTSALTLQRMGARVVIHAKERTPFTRSMRATGTWTPDSRIADADRVAADFPVLWEKMAREAFATHQTYLGTDGDPVVFSDRYALSGDGPASAGPEPKIVTAPGQAHIRFAEYGDRIRDMVPHGVDLPPEATPFPVQSTRLGSSLQFNVTELAHRLMDQFLLQGGRIETRDFHAPAEIAALPQKVVINCTGYGARALWRDETITPVRGQIAWLAPQPEVNYGVFYRGITVLSRPDGIVVQHTRNDMNGVGLDDETPDREEAEATVGMVAPLFPDVSRPRAPG